MPDADWYAGRREAHRPERRREVFDYVEIFYNATIRHSTLGMLTPTEYKDLHANTTEAA